MDIFNNRELASATLIILFLLWACYKSGEVISGLKLVLTSFFQKNIIITLLSLLLYIWLVVYELNCLEIWNTGQLKNTILWFVFVGFVQLLNASKIKDPKVYLETSLNTQIKLIVVVQFLVALHSYSFLKELLLVSIVSVLVCCNAFTSNKHEYAQASKLCNFLLAIIGTLLLIETFITIYQEPTTFFSLKTFRDFLVPMLLSVALLPYMSCFYYFLAYERAFALTRIYTHSKQLQRYAKVRSFVGFLGKDKIILKWLQFSCESEFESKKTIQDSIHKFKNKQQLSKL